MPEQHGGQARTLALPRSDQVFQGGRSQFLERLSPVRRATVLRSSQADDVGHAQRPGVGQPAAHRVLQGIELLQHARAGFAHRVARRGIDAGTHLDLAAFEFGLQQLAQGRFVLAQLLGQLESQVQEAAVDRADFQAQAAGWNALGVVTGTRLRHAFLAACVTGHAVNCHGAFRGSLRVSENNRANSAPGPFILKLCQRSNQHLCPPIP